ncbi:hypothetical protein DLAC_11458 [Tieghemostelium lacteum]|uniref:Uncharacterized protein n=1 Tax=Tieghemostelium lacteum TaxID=361077 RepID=A0A152A7Z5_TIELA|nr:hypothetical protein DLAC_11458 [Tieghemostelium lacteum]|eukprot:KYR02167.1 hypothetical protein DLAC_11458 [Tieghemostelium lacteum]
MDEENVSCFNCKRPQFVFEYRQHLIECYQSLFETKRFPLKVIGNTEYEELNKRISDLLQLNKVLQDKMDSTNSFISPYEYIKQEDDNKRKPNVQGFDSPNKKLKVLSPQQNGNNYNNDDEISNLGSFSSFSSNLQREDELLRMVDNQINEVEASYCFFHVPRSLIGTGIEFDLPSERQLANLSEAEIKARINEICHATECPTVTKNGCKFELIIGGKIVSLCKPNHF